MYVYVEIYVYLYTCPYGADAGVAIDNSTVTTVTPSGARCCFVNTNRMSLRI